MKAEEINPRPIKKPKMDPEDADQTTSASVDETLNSPNSDHGHESDEDVDSNYDDYGDDEDDYDDSYLYADDNDDKVVDSYDLQAQFDKADLPSGVEASFSVPFSGQMSRNMISKADDQASSWISAVKSLEAGRGEESHHDPEESLKKYKGFKSFDVVDDFPDHHYKQSKFFNHPTKEWAKKVQDEWRILEKDLPESIFARACESRMDLMRAAMAGPQGTPYHDGLFMFDIYFPPTYPQVPPEVNYHSGGLRINPNLYKCGKVCLSLLNTWIGSGCEMWQPGKSTMLQVLVSIQALILNDKPYFNEPGYETRFKGPKGEENCIAYSENILLLSLKTMVYTINRPPKHFEDLVAAHFCVFAHDILAACNAYLSGAPIGSVVKGEFPMDKRIKKLRSQILFNIDLAKQVNTLVPIFTKCGAKDCERFLVPL